MDKDGGPAKVSEACFEQHVIVGGVCLDSFPEHGECKGTISKTDKSPCQCSCHADRRSGGGKGVA